MLICKIILISFICYITFTQCFASSTDSKKTETPEQYFEYLLPQFNAYSLPHMLRSNEIDDANKLGNSLINFEQHIKEEKNNKRFDWLTLSTYKFTFTTKSDTCKSERFLAANTYSSLKFRGQIALYPLWYNQEKIECNGSSFTDSRPAFRIFPIDKFTYKEFIPWDSSESYLSTLSYNYVPATNSLPAYFYN